MFRADLHCHTTCSDGSYSPEEILKHAKMVGLSAISITDHDSVAAYQTGFALAKEIGVLLVPGVEFSCHVGEISVHVLGYDFDCNHEAMQDLCKKHVDRRLSRNRSILRKLSTHNIFIREEELAKNTLSSIGRPHIAEFMVKKGHVKSINEAFHHYLGEGRACYEKGDPFLVEDSIRAIHEAGGKAFIAHPHLIRHNKVIRKLLEMPFDGIECYYAKSDLRLEKQWIEVAGKKGMLISGGSDFHGTYKPTIPLGCSWVDEEAFLKIFQRTSVSL